MIYYFLEAFVARVIAMANQRLANHAGNEGVKLFDIARRSTAYAQN